VAPLLYNQLLSISFLTGDAPVFLFYVVGHLYGSRGGGAGRGGNGLILHRIHAARMLLVS
jgi:hypothetical protein